jgi:hypothetical protein
MRCEIQKNGNHRVFFGRAWVKKGLSGWIEEKSVFHEMGYKAEGSIVGEDPDVLDYFPEDCPICNIQKINKRTQ